MAVVLQIGEIAVIATVGDCSILVCSKRPDGDSELLRFQSEASYSMEG